MKVTALLPFLVACATVLAETVDIDGAKTGSLPAHWLGTQTGSGGFVVTFNGKRVIEGTDESFKDAGKVGVPHQITAEMP